MAQKVQILLVDDLTGEDADETVRFSLDGRDYEIDLTAAHAAELRSALEPFVGEGRRVRGAARARTSQPAGSNREKLQRIRAWAQENGHPVNRRGRISLDLQKAYEAAHTN
jgi:hypothetical protein